MSKAPVKIIGLTATPYRHVIGYHEQADGYGGKFLEASMTLKIITRMRPPFWARMLHVINNRELIDKGYLSPMKYLDASIYQHKDLKVNKSMSDFDLEDAAHKAETQQDKILRWLERAQEAFRSVLVFCASVGEAQRLSSLVRGSEYVTGKTKKDERKRIIDGFKSGRIKVVFNVGVLTVGFDHPALDCIFLLRPTKSLRLWYQMIGRGSRIANGKEFCTVVDWTGTYSQMGSIESIELKKVNGKLELYTDASNESWHNKSIYNHRVKDK